MKLGIGLIFDAGAIGEGIQLSCAWSFPQQRIRWQQICVEKIGLAIESLRLMRKTTAERCAQLARQLVVPLG